MLPDTEHLLSGLPLMRYDCSAELGTEFAVRVEAKHVIDTDAQVYENVCSHMKHLRLFLKVIFSCDHRSLLPLSRNSAM